MCWSTLQNIQTSSTSTQCCNEAQEEEKQKDSVLLQQKSSFRRWRYNCFMLCFSLIIKSPRQSQTQFYGFRHKLYNIEEFCKSVTIRQNLFKVKAWMWWKLCVRESVGCCMSPALCNQDRVVQQSPGIWSICPVPGPRLLTRLGVTPCCRPVFCSAAVPSNY